MEQYTEPSAQKEYLASRHKSVNAKLFITKCSKTVDGSICRKTDHNGANVEPIDKGPVSSGFSKLFKLIGAIPTMSLPMPVDSVMVIVERGS